MPESAGFIRGFPRLVFDVCESVDDPENDMRTVTLWKQTDMEGGK